MEFVDIQAINLLFKNEELYDIKDVNAPLPLTDTEKHLNYPLCVLCFSSENNELQESEKQQLERILKYLHFNLNNTPVFVCSDEKPYKYSEIIVACPCEKLIVFGGTRNSLGLHLDLKRNTITTLGATTFFVSFKLSEIESDDAKKKAFRIALDQLFQPNSH